MLNYSCKALHNAVIRKFFKPSNVHVVVANYYLCLYDQIEQINYIVLSNKPNSLYMNQHYTSKRPATTTFERGYEQNDDPTTF